MTIFLSFVSERFSQRISLTFVRCGQSRDEWIILAVVHAKFSQDTRVLAYFHPAADVFDITSLRRTRLPQRTTLAGWIIGLRFTDDQWGAFLHRRPLQSSSEPSQHGGSSRRAALLPATVTVSLSLELCQR